VTVFFIIITNNLIEIKKTTGKCITNPWNLRINDPPRRTSNCGARANFRDKKLKTGIYKC
jgi:hypothetical protein